jgi:hypothetical protein
VSCSSQFRFKGRRSLFCPLFQTFDEFMKHCNNLTLIRSVYILFGGYEKIGSYSVSDRGIRAFYGPGYVRQQAAAIQARQFFTKSRFYGEISAGVDGGAA